MKKRLLPLLILFTLISLFLPGTAQVQASYDSTVYPTEDSKLGYSYPETNSGNDQMLLISNKATAKSRYVVCLPQQPDGAEQVILRIYTELGLTYASGEVEIWGCRLTKTFDESYVSWNHRTQSDHWTTAGGDYVTTSKAVDYLDVETYDAQWLEFDITTMAVDQWDQDSDLYLVIKYRYEDKTASTYTVFNFGTAEQEAEYRPYMLITYPDPPDPTVSCAVGTILDDSVTITATPTLSGWSTTLQGRLALHGSGNYSIEAPAQNVSNDDAISFTTWAANLTPSTQYDGRIYGTYDTNQTFYSNIVDFTTLNWTLPTFDRCVSNIEVFEADVSANFSANSDHKSVESRICYWDLAWPNFPLYTEWADPTTNTTSEAQWTITDLCDNCGYYYRGEYLIDDVTYESSTDYFVTGDFGTIWPQVESADQTTAVIRVDWDSADAGPMDLWCRIGLDGLTLDSPGTPQEGETLYEDLEGYGVINFTFENLLPGHKYYYMALCMQDSILKTSPNTLYFYTEEIENPPEAGDLTGEFVEPGTVIVSWPIDLNGLTGYNVTATVWVRNCSNCDCTGPGNTSIYKNVGTQQVLDDGTVTWNLTCGTDTGDLQWESLYVGYAILDYTLGTIQSAQMCVQVPYEPFAVWTLDPIKLTTTSYNLEGWIQIGPIPYCRAQFYYWIQGQTQKTATTYLDGIITSQALERRVDNLVYGTTYCYQIHTDYGDTLGNVVCFRAGYDSGGGGTGYTGWVGDIIGFINSTLGHWILMFLGMAVVALIFFRKHRAVALILSLVILGLGIGVGWVDPWIVILLSIVGGLLIWRLIASSRQSSP
jgi:hypothetical protein